MTTPPRLCLASTSPRRHELLHQLGVPFSLLIFRTGERSDFDVDETPFAEEDVVRYVERMALTKASAGVRRLSWRQLPHQTVLSADTVVSIDGEIIGKPENAAEACTMLARLSGQTHQVYTAIAASTGNKTRSLVQTSQVRFAELNEAQINAYVASGESFDKAGGYSIQGRAAAFVAHLEGSYTGVMGLPLYETAQLLSEFDYDVFAA